MNARKTAAPPTAAGDNEMDQLRLARSEGVGPVTYRKLLARFGDAASALAALPHIARAAGRSHPVSYRDRGPLNLARIVRSEVSS